MKIIANEFVFPITEERSCHASHILPLSDEKVFCVFFCGSREGASDVRIYGSMRNPSNGSWSTPTPISEDDGIPHWNPVLFERRDGAVLLFYKVGDKIANWKTRCKISYDGCVSFGESFELAENDESGGRGPVRNKAIYLKDGSILAPASTEKGEWKCFFDRSYDGGITWEKTPSLRIFQDTEMTKRGIIQPSLWESNDGIHALMRSSEGRIYRSDSPDGQSWSQPYPTSMPNNNSGIDLAILPDQRLILACNPVTKNWGARSPLSLFVSNDNGSSFELLSHLITMPGEFSYPAVVYKNGALHVSFTHDRKTIQYFCLTEL